MQEENNEIQTIDTCKPDFNWEDLLLKLKYQFELTTVLDNLTTDFNQETINQIVLWKVNRYAEIPANTLEKIKDLR